MWPPDQIAERAGRVRLRRAEENRRGPRESLISPARRPMVRGHGRHSDRRADDGNSGPAEISGARHRDRSGPENSPLPFHAGSAITHVEVDHIIARELAALLSTLAYTARSKQRRDPCRRKPSTNTSPD